MRIWISAYASGVTRHRQNRLGCTVSRMIRTRRLFALSAVLSLAGSTGAQEPKVGSDWYEDKIEYGFKVKVPKGWDQIPPQPGEPNTLAEYRAPFNFYIKVGDGDNLPIGMFLLRFDNRSERDLTRKAHVGGESIEFKITPIANIHNWLKEQLAYGTSWRFDRDKYPKPLKVKGVDEARYWVYESSHRTETGTNPDVLVNTFVAEFTLGPDLKVCMMGNGPSDKRWRDYENAWMQLARSFTRLERVEPSPTPEASGGSPRAMKRVALEREVAKLDGWRLLESENYFILTDDEDKDFMEELIVRLEAIRDIYEEHYPAEEARAIVRRPKKVDEAEPAGGERPGAESEEAKPRYAAEETSAALDPVEASRMSVLRVCKNAQAYHSYGGPKESAGYWNAADEELVVYDDQSGGGRRDTWITLNHEAFHQYIYYFYGAIHPHSWYNEGTGDFYSGYELKHNRFILKENPWRKTTVQELIRSGKHAPLKEFVTWSRDEYYGHNDRELEGSSCYAQGWSLVYFLRTGEKKRARGWKPEWNGILDTYLKTLASTGDLDEAINKSFENIDWTAFEESWKDYILSL